MGSRTLHGWITFLAVFGAELASASNAGPTQDGSNSPVSKGLAESWRLTLTMKKRMHLMALLYTASGGSTNAGVSIKTAVKELSITRALAKIQRLVAKVHGDGSRFCPRANLRAMVSCILPLHLNYRARE